MKSQPELWELIDQPGRMQGLMSALLGRAAEVTVSQREPESTLRWEATGADEEAWIKVELAEKGWGTHVELTASKAQEPITLEGWLDAVLEELATPEKRPFEGMTKTPAGTLAEAASSKSPEQAAPEIQPEPAKAEEPTPVPVPEPQPAPRRRFFGLF